MAAAAGLVACAAWLCFPGTAAAAGAKAAAAAGSGVQAGAKTTGYFAAGGDVDRAFYRFALTLGNILSEREVASSPFAQCLVMFNTAWVTTSTAPISAAGVIGQPLGRAMIATASSHTTFSVVKFSMAMLAMSKLPTAPPAPDGSTRRRYSPPTGRSRRKPGALRKPSLGRPQVPSLPTRARARGGLSAAAAGADSAKRVTIQVRRSAKSVPRVWLMVVTALGGPSVGAVVSSVTHRLGYIAMPAALSSLSRGSVLGALAAGSLCYGGAGTWLAARWAVFQGVFGALFAAVLSPSALMFVFLCNYYARAVRASRGGPGRGGGGGRGRRRVGMPGREKRVAKETLEKRAKEVTTKRTRNDDPHPPPTLPPPRGSFL